MDLAKQIRLNRIFGHPSQRLCSVAVDHFIGYQKGLPEGLVNLPEILVKLVEGKPDAITMMKGLAKAAWEPFAGRVPLIVQSIAFTADDALIETLTRPEEVLRLGADAIAVAIGVRGPNEGKFLRILADMVEEADRVGLPVIAHIYPRDFSKGAAIVFDHDNILWAVRCGIECGADVIKVPFTGEVKSFREIVSTSPVPVVAAGGPRCENLQSALELMTKVVASGARGATIGRNIWCMAEPTRAVQAFKAVIHDRLSVSAALEQTGLNGANGNKTSPGSRSDGRVGSGGRRSRMMAR
jgi:class I fructose-bisphosphate aldolase